MTTHNIILRSVSRASRRLYVAGALIAIMTPAHAASDESANGGACRLEGVEISAATMVHDGSAMDVSMEISLAGLDVQSCEAVVIAPSITGAEGQAVALPTVGVYGRRRYYYCRRDNGDTFLGGEGETVLLARDMPESYSYGASVPYEEWMDNSRLVVERVGYGCEGSEESRGQCTAASLSRRHVELRYVRPEGEKVKARTMSGEALVTFPVSQTTLQPDYGDNRREIGKIEATIAQVEDDEDMRITSITIKGYASPEGSLESNRRLAQGRTEALRRYVEQSAHIAPGVISASYEAENWEGLRRYVELSTLPHRQDILEIIDSGGDPDERERQIKTLYADDYATLLAECYPALRRTDYKVDYTVRSFSDPDKIRQTAATAPQKLSLEELYIAAEGLEAGSPEFNEIFETAVRMYPDDPAANINAANNAMRRGDMDAAKRYLARAGSSPDADYARDIYNALSSGEATLKTKTQKDK